MATVIDTLFFELGINTSKFRGEASKATKSMDEMEKGAKKTAKSFDIAAGKLVGFISAAIVSTGLKKLIDDVTELNQKLDTTSKNLGMSARALAEWEGMAEMAGGSAGGMKNALQSISKAQTDMRVTGQSSMLPYMRALGVSMFNAAGQARPMTDIMLDLSDRFAGMSRADAFNFGQMMGFDEETLNVMLQGRGAMQDMLETQKKIYRSTDAERKASRELAKSRTLLNQQLESLGIIIVNAITPALTKLVKIVSAFVGFLTKHEKFVKAFFVGLAVVLTAMLIPALVSATAATWALLAPILVMAAPVIALATAFGLLYDDYKTWSEGGTSLFDWGWFKNQIKEAAETVENLAAKILTLIGAYKSLEEAKAKFASTTEQYKIGAKQLYHQAGKLKAQINDDKGAEQYHEGRIQDLGKKNEEIKQATPKGQGVGGKMFSFLGKIANFTPEESLAFAKAVMARENKSGRLDVVNKWGYTGKYQFGASALAETGYIDKRKLQAASKGVKNGSDAAAHKAFLADKSNWLIGDWEQYKHSAEMQDDSFAKLTSQNIKYGASIHRGDKVKMAGFAMAAHLKGAGNAKKWYVQGIDSKDGNGTRTSDYARAGEASLRFAQQASNSARMSTTNVNKTTEIAMNGDVHVHTSANTLKDNLMAASGAVYNRAIQFDTGMA